MEEKNAERIKEKAYTALDFVFGGVILSAFLAIVVVSFRLIMKGVTKLIPSVKRKEDE